MKSLELLSQMWRNPSEFRDRVSAIVSVRWESSFGGPTEYQTVDVEKAMERLGGIFGEGIRDAFTEPSLHQIEKQLRDREAELPAHAPFAKAHNGDTLLGRLCYAVSRAIQPGTVLETGVCYGVTSFYLLAALGANQLGRLYSIDLPPLGKNGADYVGWLVPRHLRRRWTLRRGTSRRLLGPVLKELGPIDLFVHDSLHTAKNMRMEFQIAWPALRPGGVLISDDIEGNDAFLELTCQGDLALSIVIQEKHKSALLGVAVKST